MKKRFSILILILCLITALTLSACNKGTNNTDNTTGTENTETETGGETGDENQTVTYTITFESNGGSAVTAITAVAGATVNAPTAPTKTDYLFGGWYSDIGLNTSYTFGTMPSGNITVYAKWTAEPTEAEYKAMCEEKLGDVIVENFNKANERYNRALTNYSVVKIDKTNGIVYGYGNVNNYGNNIFVVTTMKDSSIFNTSSYEAVFNNIKDITTESCSSKINENISTQVTSSSYNTFLDKIVTDQGFKDALAGVGVSIPFGTNNWEDVVSVVNAKVYDDGNIDVTFVDLSGNKTVTIRVGAHLTVQESTNVQTMVNNFNNKTKSYKIVESKDFSTFASIG
jgi:uncharacterized repeat protein (TIGR02543 family)